MSYGYRSVRPRGADPGCQESAVSFRPLYCSDVDKIQAIVFDFDGVLADSEPLHLRVYQEILEPHGIHLDQATYCEKYLGFDDEGAFHQIAADYNLLLGDEEIELLIAQKS